ncbi:MAG TPA: EF-hand domain-containing protein, partial [Thermoanaerobaculia bacterium]|nr:EF-hand domain-containing protein [Thermoanaerobaculia bacterium]
GGSMRNPKLIPAALVLAALAAPAVFAQSQAPAKKQTGPAQRYVDADRDGKVSRTEWKGSPLAFAQMDADGDGVLGEAELKIQQTAEAPAKVPPASRQDVEKARQNRLFRGFDKNRDGRLSKAELPGDQFTRLDRDRDGVVTREEFTGR